MLRVLIAQAELERPPEAIAGHPVVRRHAKALGKKPTQLLLDQNHHRPAMGDLPDAARRGRPDITHVTLLVLLESPLAKAGRLEVAIHTRDGDLVRIRPGTRLPRGEARFHGLLAKVLETGRSQDKDPLLWVEGRMSPAEALQAFGTGQVLRLDETATPTAASDVVGRATTDGLTLVLGGFPSGDWSEAWKEATPMVGSIWPEPLTAWATAAECMAAYRALYGPVVPTRPQQS